MSETVTQIHAPSMEEYRDARGLVVATLTYRRRIPVLDAVAWVKERLGPTAEDRDWSRVEARESGTAKRYRVTLYVPPMRVRDESDDVVRALRDAIRQRVELLTFHATAAHGQALLQDIAACVAMADRELSLSDLHLLHRTTGRLVDRVLGSTADDPPISSTKGDIAC